jgi:hypothetical protein
MTIREYSEYRTYRYEKSDFPLTFSGGHLVTDDSIAADVVQVCTDQQCQCGKLLAAFWTWNVYILIDCHSVGKIRDTSQYNLARKYHRHMDNPTTDSLALPRED